MPREGTVTVTGNEGLECGAPILYRNKTCILF